MDGRSPLEQWRVEHGLTREQLAAASGASLLDVQAAEDGAGGLAGELQDYLAGLKVNVSEMASEQSRFLTMVRGESKWPRQNASI